MIARVLAGAAPWIPLVALAVLVLLVLEARPGSDRDDAGGGFGAGNLGVNLLVMVGVVVVFLVSAVQLGVFH